MPKLSWFNFARDRAQRKVFRHLVARADRARDDGRHAHAATLYAEALALRPSRGDLHVQLGHMLKEAGDYARAERAYDGAAALLSNDADLALQRGHLFRRAGRLLEAREAYRTAQELAPDWSEPALQIAAVDAESTVPGPTTYQPDARLVRPVLHLSSGAVEPDARNLVPELTPRPAEDVHREYRPGIELRSLGRRERGPYGVRRTLRGVSAIRGICLAAHPIVEVQLLLNDVPICMGPASGGQLAAGSNDRTSLRKFSFNLWHDFSNVPDGLHMAEIRCLDGAGGMTSIRDEVAIALPLSEHDHPGSDGIVTIADPGSLSLEEAIRSQPSAVRAARRRIFPETPRNVLLMRTDQLGDLVSSIAGVRRLRELLPDARFVVLLTAANADLGRSLGIFDEVIAIDFPDDPVERRRLMPLGEQEELRERLASYRFDLAIDLAEASVSRPLLLLSGAPFLYGVGGGDSPWLTAEFNLNTHDRASRMDIVPHAAKTLALIESLGAIMRDSFRIMPREDLDFSRLERFGLTRHDYVLLHTGARLPFSRWPRVLDLAAMILARTDRTVLVMMEDAAMQASVPRELIDDPRFRLVTERPSFDDFDMLVSGAEVLVGNDSGPKHLAALRGTPVVTIFPARIDWNEWGQEEVGTIISRRVPCAGCAIYHDADECAKGFACITDIRVDEVFAAMKLPERP